MPAPEPSGFVKTLNRMGYMTSALDPYSLAFVEDASRSSLPVLDVGAAYGIASLAALERGATVIANDLESRHLEILAARAPAGAAARLRLASGAFPDALNFPPASLGAVLASRILHFLDGETLERGAAKLLQWLVPGGKVFAVTETPYIKNFSRFLPVYESRKKAGLRWPGFVEDTALYSPTRAKDLPPWLHFQDEETLGRTFREAGFIIEKVATMPRPDFPPDVRLDGRESVGIIARKPA